MSEIRANTVSDAAGTGPATLTGQSAAKAWVNFNGSGTIAARDSFNVSSLTDNDMGYYTVSSTNAFNNSNYSPSVTSNRETSTNYPITQHAIELGTGYVLVLLVRFDNDGWSDSNIVSVQNFGDLA